MAAKPPKPPANLLNERNANVNTKSNNNNHNNSNATSIVNESEPKTQTQTNYVNNNNNNNCGTSSSDNSDNNGTSIVGAETTPHNVSPAPAPRPPCNCTNISIMHLFHEMKQEFPTIPDPIVTQCVNENCHQRENCMQVLRNELILNPIPVQSYPAKLKILPQTTRQHLQQHQQQPQQRNSATKPAKPLKPTRVAPSPLTPKALTNACDNSSKNLQKPKDVHCSDMPTTTAPLSQPTPVAPPDQQELPPTPSQRLTRPTTLDLLGSHRDTKQQRQQLNSELQKRLQQREQQQQSNAQPLQPIPTNRPSRRAPLPPLPPKPSYPYNGNGPHSSNTTSPISQTYSNSNSFSNDSSRVVSPISSCSVSGGIGGESEISVNVSLSSPTAAASAKNQQLKSPIRHRSVITLQPEPPYAKYVAPQSAASPGQKSFTSLNLTLRQPNPSVPPSTIDISAGPSPSGAGSGLGLTYSSTTYDGRSGYKKNFHITVTDQVGAFSASRIGPRTLANQPYTTGDQQQQYQQPYGQQHKYVSRAVSQQQLELQHRLEQEQQQQHHQQQQQQLQSKSTRHEYNDKMCYGEEHDAFANTLQRQKDKRDKLASALRDNKKRLGQMMNDIVLLTEPVSAGLDERLDSEIMQLRADCKALVHQIDNSTRSGPSVSIEQYPTIFPVPLPPGVMQSPNGGGSSASVDGGSYYGVAAPSMSSSACTTPTNGRTDNGHIDDNEDDVDDDDDDSYDVNGDDDLDEEKWSCSMCTFQNHPLLNICEQCDNVRILPGTVRIVPAAVDTAKLMPMATPTQRTPTPSQRTTIPCMPQNAMHSMVAGPNAMLAAAHPNTNANNAPSPSLSDRTNLNSDQPQCFGMQQMANCSL